jgi:hypothetical protein
MTEFWFRHNKAYQTASDEGAPPMTVSDAVAEGLRERCKAMYQKMGVDAMLRQGSPVDDLMAFVLAEIGRSADVALEKTLPLVLYFQTDEDREEFIAAVHEAKPGMMSKRLP